jgi:UDP-N-acetylmuramate--alanine ligase
LPIKKDGFTYGINSTSSDYTAHNIRIEKGQYIFDFKNGKVSILDIKLGIAGLHNIENATAAIIVGLLLDISTDKIKAALADFKGVKRRFEYIVRNDNTIYIDDYAHHPEELKACLNSVRQLYPNRKVTAVFQPHLYTRTRDFAEGFSEALSLCDELILLDIYPARELPIEGVSSEMLLDDVTIEDKMLCSKHELMDVLAKKKIDVLVTMGAGDIDTFVEPIKNMLLK